MIRKIENNISKYVFLFAIIILSFIASDQRERGNPFIASKAKQSNNTKCSKNSNLLSQIK
jgi:hypothetical protein